MEMLRKVNDNENKRKRKIFFSDKKMDFQKKIKYVFKVKCIFLNKIVFCKTFRQQQKNCFQPKKFFSDEKKRKSDSEYEEITTGFEGSLAQML